MKLISISENVKDAQKKIGLEMNHLNLIIRSVYAVDFEGDMPDELLCRDAAEAKSFYISLVNDAPIKPEDRDKILASLGLLVGYQEFDGVTERRKHYLAEREQYAPSYIEGIPFTELSEQAQKNKADGINRISAYNKLEEFFSGQPNRMGYIRSAMKRHIIMVDGKTDVILPTPSYMPPKETSDIHDGSSAMSEMPLHNSDEKEAILSDLEHADELPAEAASETNRLTKREKRYLYKAKKHENWMNTPKEIRALYLTVIILAGVVLLVVFYYGQVKQPVNEGDILVGISQELENNEDALYLKLSSDLDRLLEDEAFIEELLQDQDKAESKFMLGITYFTRKEYSEAETWLLAADKQGYSAAKGILCILYYYGVPNLKALYRYATEAANNNDAVGYFYTGLCYARGYVVEQNYETAAEYYQCVIDGKGFDGATLTEPLAEYNEIIGKCLAEAALATLYYKGEGVKQNYTKSLSLYKAAYDDGRERCATSIGLFYYFGYGVKKDLGTAYSWFYRAAENGDTAAMATIGLFYYKGVYVDQDTDEAIRWLRKATNLGNPDAEYYLNEILRNN